MFAGLPPPSSDLAERKALFRHLLLQIGGANIGEPAYFVVVGRRLSVSTHSSSVRRRAIADARSSSL
jgi:hypothetical protein